MKISYPELKFFLHCIRIIVITLVKPNHHSYLRNFRLIVCGWGFVFDGVEQSRILNIIISILLELFSNYFLREIQVVDIKWGYYVKWKLRISEHDSYYGVQ